MNVVRTQAYSLYNTFPKEMTETVLIYRQAVEVFARIACAEWPLLSLVQNQNTRRKKLENLVHSTDARKVRGDENLRTEGNVAKYPCFDMFFNNLPSYFRRAATDDALGLVESHMTRLNTWKDKKADIILMDKPNKWKARKIHQIGEPPTFQPITKKCPVMFRGNGKKITAAVEKETASTGIALTAAEKSVAVEKPTIAAKPKVGKNRSFADRIVGLKKDAGGVFLWMDASLAALKLYDGKNWKWYCVKLKQPKKQRFTTEDGWSELSPTLQQTGSTFEIHIPYEKKIVFADGGEKPVLSVDLGLNTRAVASVVTATGAILGRIFIDIPQETGQLKHLLGKIAQGYKLSGQPQKNRKGCRTLWNKVRNLTDDMSHKVAGQLVAFAELHGCKTIVFEHLAKMKVPKDFYGAKRLRCKLHYWLAGRIQKYAKQKAHLNGIRFSRVLARGTSAEAFDGSGSVVRTGTMQEAVFATGKRYNADLLASYNIGARFWIRELFKIHPKAKNAVKNAGKAIEGKGGKTQSSKTLQAHSKDTTVMAITGGQSTSVVKARVGNSLVTGKGKSSCPVSAPVLHVCGVPVARHQQTLASLISFGMWVSSQSAATKPEPYSCNR